MAEEEAERGAEVVELFGGDALGLGVAGGVEPGELAVEDEELAGGLIVDPAHAAGLFEEEGAGFGAVHAHAGVVLGVAGAEAGEVVVVVVDLMEDGAFWRGGVCSGGGAGSRPPPAILRKVFNLCGFKSDFDSKS